MPESEYIMKIHCMIYEVVDSKEVRLIERKTYKISVGEAILDNEARQQTMTSLISHAYNIVDEIRSSQ